VADSAHALASAEPTPPLLSTFFTSVSFGAESVFVNWQTTVAPFGDGDLLRREVVDEGSAVDEQASP
jgi:hypothetical protein